MPIIAEIKSCVETIDLLRDMEKRVALAAVRLGEVVVKGIAVWRGGNGHLRVFFPSYKQGPFYVDAIQLSEDMRTQVEADVISAYKAAKSVAKKSDN
jgi:DNA-binding cell septation regulator SpoVG